MSNSKFQHCGHCLLSLWLPISCLVQHSSKTPFHCFDSLAALSIDYKCNIMPARGTKNFDIAIVYSGKPAPIHIHVQLRLAGTSLCRRCLEAGKILSAPNSPYHASEVDEQCSDDVKHWKDCFYRIKQNIPFRTTGFQCRLQCPFYRKI